MGWFACVVERVTLHWPSVGLGAGAAAIVLVLVNGTPVDFEGFGVKVTTWRTQAQAARQEVLGHQAQVEARVALAEKIDDGSIPAAAASRDGLP